MLIKFTGRIVFLVWIFASIVSCQQKSSKQNESGTEVNSSNQGAMKMKSDPIKEEMLRTAALEGNIAVIEGILSQDINFDAVDADGRTALMLCCFNGHTDIAKKLIDLGSVVNSTDFLGRTALMYACTGPYPGTVELLINNKADLNMVDKDESFSALMFAAAEGQMEVVKLLLKHNSDPYLTDKDGDTAESFARQNGHTDVADYINTWIKKL